MTVLRELRGSDSLWTERLVSRLRCEQEAERKTLASITEVRGNHLPESRQAGRGQAGRRSTLGGRASGAGVANAAEGEGVC